MYEPVFYRVRKGEFPYGCLRRVLSGLKVTGGVLSVDRNPDTVASGLECTDGAGLSLTIQHTDTASVTLDGNGTAASPLTATASVSIPSLISSDNCNALVQQGSGLYVACQDGVSGSINCTVVGVNQPVAGPDANYAYPATCSAVITNPTCCEVRGQVQVKVGGAFIDMCPESYGFGVIATATDANPFPVSPNGAFPMTNKVVHNHVPPTSPCVPVLLADVNNLEEQNLLILASGATVTYNAQFTWRQQVGTGTLHGDIGFEFYWTLIHTGCCDHL